jgi:alpha-galactosidase
MKRRKIVLIGAGSAVFTQGLIADLIMTDDLGAWEVGLVDTDPAALKAISSLVSRMISAKGADIPVQDSVERRDVLAGADVVVTTVAVGGRRAWEKDVFIPRKYGINQPVGDTTMPGGISRALRMIPAMLEIARDIKELCPEAYFFNYSNPMTPVCQAIRNELDIPVIGLCHGVIHVEQHIGRLLGHDPEKIRSLGAGLNHLTFLYDLRFEGRDLHPELAAKSREGLAKLSHGHSEAKIFQEMGGNERRMPEIGDNPFTWSLYLKYGAVPAVLDRHVVEFFPQAFPHGAYYGGTLGVDAITFEGVIAQGDEVYREMTEQAMGNSPINEQLFNRSAGEHEQLLEILRSLYLDQRKLFSVNLPNRGAVAGLPNHSVLEFPAVAAGRGFQPLSLPDFPDSLASLLLKRIAVVDKTVEAAVTGNVEAFKEALLLDGSVEDEQMADRLASELLEAHRAYLPQFFA